MNPRVLYYVSAEPSFIEPILLEVCHVFSSRRNLNRLEVTRFNNY
jgi:hypothetical protein